MKTQRIVKSWLGLLILAVVAAAAFYFVKTQAPKADSNCTRSYNYACLTVYVFVDGGTPARSTVRLKSTSGRIIDTQNTDSNGVANFTVYVSRGPSGADYVLTASAPIGYIAAESTMTIRGSTSPSKTFRLESRQVEEPTPQPSTEPTSTPSTVASSSCKPNATPISAANACLNIYTRVQKGSRLTPLPNVTITGNGASGITNTKGLLSLKVPLRPLVDRTRQQTVFIPQTFALTATSPDGTVAMIDASSLADKLKESFVAHAAGQTTKSVTINSPRVYPLYFDFLDSSTGDDDNETAGCRLSTSSNQRNAVTRLLGIESAQANNQLDGVVCINVQGLDRQRNRFPLVGFQLKLKQLPQEGEKKDGKWWTNDTYVTDYRGILNNTGIIRVMIYDNDKDQFYQAYSDDQIVTNLSNNQKVRCKAVPLPNPLPYPIKNKRSKDYVAGDSNTVQLKEDQNDKTNPIRWFGHLNFEVECEPLNSPSPASTM